MSVRTWLRRAYTVQIEFGYENSNDKACQRVMGPAVSDWTVGMRRVACYFAKKKGSKLLFLQKKKLAGPPVCTNWKWKSRPTDGKHKVLATAKAAVRCFF